MTPPDDRQIEDRLRAVDLPPAIEDGIRLESLFDDAALDRLLTRVPLPGGLVDRVRAAAVVAPPRARPQGPVDLERIATAGRMPAPLDGRGRAGGRLAGVVRDLLAVTLALSVVAAIVAASSELSRQLVAVPATDASDDVRIAPNDRREPFTPQPAVVAATRLEGTPRSNAAEPLPSVSPVALDPPSVAGLPAAEALADQAAIPPAIRGAAVGTGDTESRGDASTALAGECEVPGESLRSVPRVRGYDLAHEMTYGEQPFVDPAAAAALATDSPPLCLHTNSFDRRVFAAADARWSPGLRAEHVLAALPAPPRIRSDKPRPGRAAAEPPVRLDLRAITSLRTAPRRSVLVDVCLTASRPREANRPPLHATLILDRSIGGDPLVWRWMCRGLGAVAAEMETGDRLTVLIGGSVPQLALKAGDATAVMALAEQLEQQSPQAGTADLDAVVRVARQEPEVDASRLVVVAQSVTLERARDDVRVPLTAWQAALAECGGEPLDCHAAASGPRFVVIDTASPAEPPTRQPSFGRTPADPVAIRRAVVQHVFGRDARAARQCRLDVSFDPRQVAAYRLVGHRQSAFESLSLAPPAAIDLYRGETCRVVYEVFPRDGFGKGAVSATAQWSGRDDGRPAETTAVLATGPDGQASVPEASLCELLLAVTLGDAAGGSPHVDPKTIAAAKAVASRWRARGDVTAFGSAVIDCLERLRSDRRGAR